MRRVVVELRPLVRVDGVLHRERVQAEFLADRGKILFARLAQVEPDDRVLLGEVVGHLLDRETLVDKVAVAVTAGQRHTE